MKSIILDIFKDLPLTEKEVDVVSDKLKKTTLKKREFLLKEGEEINHFYYIHQGCLRTYFIDPSGKEHTLQFAVKGWWISDYIALFGKEKTKAVSYIECIKDSILYSVSKKDFDNICKEIPKVGYFHIKNLESAFSNFQKRILENLTLSAKERYINFVTVYPNIEQNVKNYHIASYLGITTESLSRIRKEITLT